MTIDEQRRRRRQWPFVECVPGPGLWWTAKVERPQRKEEEERERNRFVDLSGSETFEGRLESKQRNRKTSYIDQTSLEVTGQ